MRIRRAKVMLALTAITFAFALATGHPMFWRSTYVFLALLAIAGIWVWVMGRGVDVEVRRLALRSSAGGSIQERVLVRRRSRLQRGWLEVMEQTTMPTDAPGALVNLEEANGLTVELETKSPQRGLFEIGPLLASTSDPFGLFQVRRQIGVAQALTVHPRTVELPGFVLLPADLPGEGPRHVRSSHVTTSAYGIRDYNFGDSLNRISWKATAHHDRLMVKEFEVEPANNIWVLLDLDRRSYTGATGKSAEETAVSIAASICRRYVDVHFPVGLMAWSQEPVVVFPQRGPGHLIQVLDVMAGLRATGGKHLLDLIGDLHALAGRFTSVAIVTPSITTDWLEGVSYLLEKRARVTVVIVDGNTRGSMAPPSAEQAVNLGLPTYIVRVGQEAQGLTPLMTSTSAWDSRANVPVTK
ncbi:MAG: hypothetical protein HW397_37 [Dehalococcoidia bacterium]|nr:hypothetical protein [Dehalococcoidia bacterium]